MYVGDVIFSHVGPVACGIGNIYVSAVLEQVVINFQRVRQVAPRCLTSSSYTMATNCGVLPLVSGLQHVE